MSRRRYSYSYSPSPKRERVQRRGALSRPGLVLLPALVVLVAAVLLHELVSSGEGSAASRSNCWTQVACSAERVQPSAQDSAASSQEPDYAADQPASAYDSIDRDEGRDPPRISGAAAAVIEEPCGALVHNFNAHARLSPASLTKIVTALVAVERSDIRQTVHVTVDGGALSAATDATVMGLRPGQSLGMVDLLYGMLLPSGNDAAIAIAEQVAGSVEAFADLMNARVAELGLEDSHFVNPHGLDEPGHYTSAYDIAVLGSRLLRDPDLAFIVGTRTYQPAWDGPALHNLNLLLGQYPGAIGIKTGYTLQAGHTIVAAAERGGQRFIVSVLDSSDIYADATALLDWAFASAPSVCGPASGSQVAASR